MITILRSLTCGLLLLAVPIAAAGPPEPVVIIYQISGGALRTAPGRSPEPLRLYDRLPAGTTVELKPFSHLTLAFATGKRYELSGPARVTLGKGDLAVRSGGVRALATVPPFPLLAPISESEKPGVAAGAVWIRGNEIQGLYPHHGARALASTVTLRFAAVEGARHYRIEVENRQGEVVYSAETESSEVVLPAHALHPGVSYHWSVRTVDRPGAVARGEADFATLDPETARAREELRHFVERTGGGEENLSLLAGVDQGLGLLAEARTERRSLRPYAPRAGRR
jgi:hypothetical protein